MIIERELGSIPISIPTAIPFEETVMADEFERRNIWINVRTLVRNLLHSLEANVKASVSADSVVTDVLDEVQQLMALYGQLTDDQFKLVFFVTDRSEIPKNFPHALLKGPNTPKQKHDTALIEEATRGVANAMQLEWMRVKVEGKGDRAYILTHQPVHLLSRAEFADLKLLESHTGKIKGKGLWSTKLKTKGSENLPFNALTLQMFGDGDYFTGFPIKLKRALLALGKERGWTPLSTNALIESHISKHEDPAFVDVCLKLLRTRIK